MVAFKWGHLIWLNIDRLASELFFVLLGKENEFMILQGENNVWYRLILSSCYVDDNMFQEESKVQGMVPCDGDRMTVTHGRNCALYFFVYIKDIG